MFGWGYSPETALYCAFGAIWLVSVGKTNDCLEIPRIRFSDIMIPPGIATFGVIVGALAGCKVVDVPHLWNGSVGKPLPVW